jgi:methionyl-tRNA synthetase
MQENEIQTNKIEKKVEEENNYIDYDAFKSADIRVGTIRKVFTVDNSEKLYRCLIEFTPDLATETITITENDEEKELGVRQILSGIRIYFPNPEELVGRQLLYIVNLAPRKMMGFESHGMLLAVGDEKPVFLIPEHSVESGSKVR